MRFSACLSVCGVAGSLFSPALFRAVCSRAVVLLLVAGQGRKFEKSAVMLDPHTCPQLPYYSRGRRHTHGRCAATKTARAALRADHINHARIWGAVAEEGLRLAEAAHDRAA